MQCLLIYFDLISFCFLVQFQKQHTYINPPSIPSPSSPQHPRSRSPQHPPPPPPIMTLPSFGSMTLPGNSRKNILSPPSMAPPPPPSTSLPPDSTVRFGALPPAPPIPSVAGNCQSNESPKMKLQLIFATY